MKTFSTKLPYWFRQRIPAEGSAGEVSEILERHGLNTVCESAECPNRVSCYSSRTATFMILGGTCTRNCAFCAVSKGKPSPPDPEEPGKIALAITELGLRYAVITSTTRDDLPDEGAAHFASTVETVKKARAGILVELLIPDIERVEAIVEAGPDVIGHNIETVPRLYPRLRPEADYIKSLGVLSGIKDSGPDIVTKSGLMLGLGEKEEEIESVMDGLLAAGCSILTLGQYLRPSPRHFPVMEYIPPERFKILREKALARGFKAAAAAPLVRSSYRAEEIFGEMQSEY